MRGYVLGCHVIALVVGCAGSSPQTRSAASRGLRASDHLADAREHDEQARENARWADTRSDSTGRVDQLLIGHARWDTTADHRRAAAHHRSSADALYAEYEQACGNLPMSKIAISPIVRYGMGGRTTTSGVVLYLSPQAGPADRLLAELKCHRAWMMLAATSMDDCPLDLAGLLVDAKADDEMFTLTLSVRDPALVPELQRRTAHDLELGGR
jgi:hypothetical protein